MQYSLSQQSKRIIFNPPIDKLDKITIKFTDPKDKEYVFDNLDFSFQIIIKLIKNMSTIINNESSNDITTIVRNNLLIRN